MTRMTKIGIIMGFLWISLNTVGSSRLIKIDNDTDLYVMVKDIHSTSKKSLKDVVLKPWIHAELPFLMEPHSKVSMKMSESLSLDEMGLQLNATTANKGTKLPFLRLHRSLDAIVLYNNQGGTWVDIGSMKLPIYPEYFRLRIKQADNGFVHQFFINSVQLNLIRGRYFLTTAYHPYKQSCSFVVCLESHDARERKNNKDT